MVTAITKSTATPNALNEQQKKIISDSQEKTDYTPEEYFALEETAEGKQEYYDGKIIPMTGGTTNHNTLSINFVFAFLSTFSNQDYRVYINDVQL